MKLVRFETAGRRAIGAMLDDAHIVDLSRAAGEEKLPPDSMSAFLARGKAGMEQAIAMLDTPHPETIVPLSEARLLAPVGDPSKIMCIGQNYRDHCEEQNQPIPEKAILFAKYPNTLNDPDGEIRLLAITPQIDYEAELAVVIGTATRNVTEENAMQHVAGYLCANDVTARDIQKGDGQWVRGKSPDTFFPIGPYLVTANAVPDPHNLAISLTLNGETMQTSNTENLIFKIPFLIAYLSQTMTLLPGDILSTGTPGGVGVYRTPQVFLKAGDTVAVTIDGLGTLTNSVVAP